LAAPVANEVLQQIGSAALCPRCRGVLDVLWLPQAGEESAQTIALRAGFRNRIHLAHELAKHGLPPLTALRDWICLLTWVREWEVGGYPLVRQAWDGGREPSVCYRTVHRVTRLAWREARLVGLGHWIREFDRALRLRSRCPNFDHPKLRGEGVPRAASEPNA